MKDKNFLIQNGVNVEKSLELFGDMETYNDTLKEFITEINEKKANLQKYKEVSDMANYAIYAHSIKSDAKYFGFDQLAEFALNHEMAGKQNNMYYVSEHYEEFMNELARIENLVKEYMGMAVTPAPISQELSIKDKSILVVDDSAVIKKFIQSIFNNKYQVIEAADGNEALNIINSKNYNISCMLLDLNMPNVNGFQVLEYFRQNNLFNTIPITIITGVGADNIIAQAKTYPIKGIILKPFNERDIRNAVETEEII